MINRERMKAALNYQPYDRLPLVHFGFWHETLLKWIREGHLDASVAETCWDGSSNEALVTAALGFDLNYQSMFGANTGLVPVFEREELETLPNGLRKVRNSDGVVVMQSDEAGSIPAEVGHLLVDRSSWETHYLPRLQYSADRVNRQRAAECRERGDVWLGLHCGSLLGMLRNWIGVEGLSYLWIDDEPLAGEMIDTIGHLSYRLVEDVLGTGVEFDFAHFWEDICYKNGPLVHPRVFAEKCGPHYRRLVRLLRQHGVPIVSVDCDGWIDALLSTWLENGVNTMFPIEVGTWGASIAPWRQRYGRDLRGVGGMDKRVFAQDRKAVDAEVERLRCLVDLGGYVPCPDHRIPPDAQWDNVRYYCDRMRQVFG